MLDLGHDRVTRRLWLVNCVANDGLAIELSDGQNHTDVVDLITNELRLGDIPTLMLDTGSAVPTGRYFPDGLANLANFSSVVFESEEVTWERIQQTVDGVYRSSLITPEVQNTADSLWTKADDYWSASDAEFKVQSAIKAGLAGAFPFCDIRSEQPQAEGRHDLLVEEYTEDAVGLKSIVPHAMIELKMLKSRNSAGASVSDNVTGSWALSGVKQAHSYGTGRHSKLLLAFCIDARYPNAGMECLQAAFDLAIELGVILGRWKIYGRSSDLRDKIAAEAANGG
jgi:hypothetical protein